MYKKFLISLAFFSVAVPAFAISGQFDISASTGFTSTYNNGGDHQMFQTIGGFIGSFRTVVLHIDKQDDTTGHYVSVQLFKCRVGESCEYNGDGTGNTLPYYQLIDGHSPTSNWTGASDIVVTFDSLVQATSTSQQFVMRIGIDGGSLFSLYGTSGGSQSCFYGFPVTAVKTNCVNIKESFWSIQDANDVNAPYVIYYYPSGGQSVHGFNFNFDINYFVPADTVFDTFQLRLYSILGTPIHSWSKALVTGTEWFHENSGDLSSGAYFYQVCFTDSSGVLDSVCEDLQTFDIAASFGVSGSWGDATNTPFAAQTFYSTNLPNAFRQGSTSSSTQIYETGSAFADIILKPLWTMSRAFADRFTTADATTSGAMLASSTMAVINYVYSLQYIFLAQDNPLVLFFNLAWTVLLVTFLASVVRYLYKTMTLR